LIWPQDNIWLKDLPVSKSLEKYDIEDNFCLVAATGSGKTMVIAPAVAMQTRRKVIIRQPTRQIAWLVYKSLSDFWGSQLKIGIRTREKKIGSIAENDITVVTDGVMRSILAERNEGITVIFDEAHWMHEPTEIELGLVKTLINGGANVNCILLSATVRPSNFLIYFEEDYKNLGSISSICKTLDDNPAEVNDLNQPQNMKCYYAEGVMFPVEKSVTHLDNQVAMAKFCQKMIDENKRGLVFLTTRKEVENACIMFSEKWKDKDIDFNFCHADRNVDEIKQWVEENEPSVLFTTVSMATSATLPFDDVLIIDRGLESNWVDDMPILKTNQPIDNNGLIQRAGRVGRTKIGRCILNTNHKIAYGSARWLRNSWDDIKPIEIKPPLESLPLDMVVLTCAAYGLKIDELDVMSKLSEMELHEISNRMIKAKIIEDDDGRLALTTLGKRINGMQMGVWPAFSLCKADKEMQSVVLASQTGPAIFGLFASEEKLKEWGKENREHISMSAFKAGLMKEALSMTKSEREEWCDENGISVKKIEGAIRDFKDKAKRVLNRNPADMIQCLVDYDNFENDLIDHNNRNRMQKTFVVAYDYRWGYNGNVLGSWAMCSKDEVELLKIPLGGTLEIKASPKRITTKKGKEMIILEDITLVKAT